MTVETGSWDALRSLAQPIRYAVFVLEQGVPVELEWDDQDEASIHAIARDSSGRAIATGRLLPDGHIGRMAVLKEARGQGLGAAVLAALIEAAERRGDKAVVLSAQIQAAGFYARHGFQPEGPEYMEAGIRHVSMRRVLG